MELTEQEAHCITRHLQALLYGRGLADACNFCKFQCFLGLPTGAEPPMYDYIKKRLTEKTGVELSVLPWDTLPELGDFPYKKFLINANERIIDYYRERWGYSSP